MVCTYDMFWRACIRLNKYIVLKGDDKAMLSKLGGLSSAAAHGTIVTIAACCKALQHVHTPTQVLSAILDLKDNPATQLYVGLPDHVMAPCAQPSTNPSELQMAAPFPTTLPVIQLPPDFHKKHGLRARHKAYLASRAPLSQQMAELKLWLTTPYMLTRKGPSINSTTWDNVEDSILLFLGHCHEYQQATQPTLQLFLFPNLLAHFVSCHAAAKHKASYVSNMLSHFAVVLKWWQTKPGGTHPSFDEGLKWLHNLKSQVMH